MNVVLVSAAMVLQLATQGGFSGRGAGGVELRSDGVLRVESPGGARCETRLPLVVRRELRSAIAHAAPESWPGALAPASGADQIEYTLTVQRRGRAFIARWRDGEAEKLAKDLKTLVGQVQATAAEALEQCRNNKKR